MLLEWSTQCEQMWVYEHEADDKISRTHCHIFVIGSQRDSEGLKKRASWFKSNIEKGNSGSSFKMYKQVHDFGHEGKWYKALAYASKGYLQPRMAHGVDADAIANASLAEWATASTDAVVVANETGEVVRKSKRVTQYQIARMAQTAYMLEHTESFTMYCNMSMSKLQKIIVRLLKENQMLAHKRIVANIISDIQADLNPNEFLRQVLSLV